MKAKIQYHADLNQVVQEVKKLLPASADWTYELNVMSTFLNKNNPEVVATIIDSTRQSLYDLDQRLQDCQVILNGYVSARKQEQQTQDLDVESLREMASMIQPQGDADGTTS
jgi:uncharacterized protein YqgV (UPF0045/DUF77 family)